MSRKHLTFNCAGATLAATLDEAQGNTGLLLVTGGNETRAGAFSGQASIAAKVAAAGYPVFRFDRRGVGDSEGDNGGFRESEQDIAAAIAAFRDTCPTLTRIVGFGNCDAASALMLAGGAGLDSLVLANPWTIEDNGSTLTPQAVRARYAGKLRQPRQLLRLVTGKISLRKLAEGIKQALRPAPPRTGLAHEMAAALARYQGPVDILLAGHDRTAQAFEACWPAGDSRIIRCPDADHAFSGEAANGWLQDKLLDALRRASASQTVIQAIAGASVQ